MAHIGEKIKNAIKGKGMSQEDAALKLGITRQTLHNSILKMPQIEEEVLQNVITKLGLVLQIEEKETIAESRKNGDSDKYIALLEKNLHEKDDEIARLKKELAEAQQIQKDLNDVLKNQKTILSRIEAGQDVILQKMSGSPKEHQKLIKNVDNNFFLKRKALEKMDNHLDTGIPGN